MLFVGNLTYLPNADAAVRLVHEVLPRLRGIADQPVTVTLAGEPDDTVRSLAAEPGVQVTGFVPDLAPCYRDADVVVAPLAAGGGTRIKLLEAFGYGLPVVTSTVGAAGLDVADGVHVLMADSPGEAARAVAALAGDRGLRERLVTQARRLVSRSYSHDAVIPRIREFFAAAELAAAPSRAARPGPACRGASQVARGSRLVPRRQRVRPSHARVRPSAHLRGCADPADRHAALASGEAAP